jgi:hypothetical protein
MKNSVLWDTETQFIHHRRHITIPLQSQTGECYLRFEVLAAMIIKNTARRLLVRARVFPSSLILVTLMKEALSSSETSVLTKATRRNIPEHGILLSHRRENFKSYIGLTDWTL